MNPETLLVLEEILVDAAVDPTAWTRALNLVAARLGAFGAVVLPVIGREPNTRLKIGREPNALRTESLLPLVDRYFQLGWYERDRRMLGIPQLVRTGLTVDQDIFGREEMRRDPYWLDFLERQGLRWFGGIRVKAAEDLWCLALQRTPEQGAFLVEEQAAFMPLGAALSRSATLLNQLGEARLEGLTDALHILGVPALVLDRQGRVARVNAEAEGLFGHALTLRRGELVAVNRLDVTGALKRHFDAVLRPDGTSANVYLEGVAVPRNACRPLFVQAHPLRGALSSHFSSGRAVVLITDPNCAPIAPRAALRALFSLTDSEARLVQALAEGRSLTGAAFRIGVTYETARSYLKSIFAKTGAQGQNELIVLASGLARHRVDE